MRRRSSTTAVTTAEMSNDPRQPIRFEKKKNTHVTLREAPGYEHLKTLGEYATSTVRWFARADSCGCPTDGRDVEARGRECAMARWMWKWACSEPGGCRALVKLKGAVVPGESVAKAADCGNS
jgi:hypothetical protein